MAHTWTFDKLMKSGQQLNPSIRGKNSRYTPKFEISHYTSGPHRGQKVIVPFMGTKSVLISMRAWGVTQSSLHNVTLLFSNVEILKEDPKSRNYFQIEYDGQMYWIQKFDRFRHPLTSRCTCFTGDTQVLLADGTYKSFKELEGKTDFEIISYNEKSDKFEIVKAYNCEKKKENAELVEVFLDNGTSYKCTPDHRTLLRDGTWVQAKDLKEGDSLRALYLDKNKMERVLPDNTRQKIKKHKAKENYYVYVYLDPRYPGKYEYDTVTFDYKPIYVGKGTGNRCLHHVRKRGLKIQDPFHRTLNNILEEGLEPILLRLHVKLDEQTAFKLENRLTKEIGLMIENKGPLLNLRQGGEGGCSKYSGLKTKIKNLENGCYEKTKQRMLENNPMKDSAIANRRTETYKFIHTEEERKEIGYKACHSLSYEERKQLGKKVAEHNRQAVKNGTHHTLTEEWKQLCKENAIKRFSNPEEREKASKHSKAAWQDPILREKMLKNKQETHNKKKKFLYDNTISQLAELARKHGEFNIEDYVYEKGFNYSVNMIKNMGRYTNIKKEVLEQAFLNHKVVKVVSLQERQDVYCLTAEYLGNFVIRTENDSNKNIISGVSVENCADYFYRFAWYNYYNAHCLYGPAPRAYQKKTNRPPQNPRKLPGICKHIINAWQILANSGLTIN